MNIEKHLILLKGEDKTDEISHCAYENSKWQVEFAKGKTYSYSYPNVQWFKDPVSPLGATTLVYQNNQLLSGVDKLFIFGDYIRICFVTGNKKVYRSQEIKIEQSCLNNSDAYNIFEYLKLLAEKVGVTNEDESNFLRKQYEKLTYASPSSVLIN